MGAYCRIMFTMWLHGAKLPDNDRELAQIVGISGRRFASIRDKVMRPIMATGGVLSQKRLTETWLNVQELRRKRTYASHSRRNLSHDISHDASNDRSLDHQLKLKEDSKLASLSTEPRTNPMLKPEELIASPDLVKLLEEQNRKRGMPPASSATALDGAPPRPAIEQPKPNGKVPHRVSKEELEALYANRTAANAARKAKDDDIPF